MGVRFHFVASLKVLWIAFLGRAAVLAAPESLLGAVSTTQAYDYLGTQKRLLDQMGASINSSTVF